MPRRRLPSDFLFTQPSNHISRSSLSSHHQLRQSPVNTLINQTASQKACYGCGSMFLTSLPPGESCRDTFKNLTILNLVSTSLKLYQTPLGKSWWETKIYILSIEENSSITFQHTKHPLHKETSIRRSSNAQHASWKIEELQPKNNHCKKKLWNWFAGEILL